MKQVDDRQQPRKKKPPIQKINLNYFFLIHIILLIFIDSSQLKVKNVLSIIK